jgi:hypothetical protein
VAARPKRRSVHPQRARTPQEPPSRRPYRRCLRDQRVSSGRDTSSDG